jgi:cytosine/adenosine deaminase-related metal-dependent hydrolase
MANLHANVLQIGQPERMAELFAMISERSARLMNLGDYGLRVGNPADVVIIDASTPATASAGSLNSRSRAPWREACVQRWTTPSGRW